MYSNIAIHISDILIYVCIQFTFIQGRISFYLTHYGEEAAVIASAAALDFDDTIYGQYREAGALLWRGFTVEQCVNQCYGNHLDKGHGRQMPIHYGDKDLNFQTICSHVSVQVPQGN